MSIAFYICATVAIISTLLVITERNIVHSLLYLILSLFSVAVIFFLFGAPFAAALEILIYAGAIMVVFVFVIMILNLGKVSDEEERKDLKVSRFIGPVLLASVLIIEIAYVIFSNAKTENGISVISPKQVGASLFGTYLLMVELTSLLLLVGLLGAYHLGGRSGSK